MDDGDPHDLDMELEGNGALDIYDDAPIIAYLQTCEILIGLSLKERDRVVIGPNNSNGKVIPSYGCG